MHQYWKRLQYISCTFDARAVAAVLSIYGIISCSTAYSEVFFVPKSFSSISRASFESSTHTPEKKKLNGIFHDFRNQKRKKK